ncbi:MAG: PaaI family thioesterase [Pseudolysinimonas sp.]
MDSSTRSRTITWSDPAPPLQLVRTMSGLEYLTALAAGDIPAPPIAQTLGFGITSVDRGSVIFSCEPDESHYNPIGVVHGGVLCTLLDTVLGCAVHSTLEAGWGYTSIDLNVTYLRPVTVDSGMLVATGAVTKGGRRVSFATGEIRDAAGAVVATATGALLMIAPSTPSQQDVRQAVTDRYV